MASLNRRGAAAAHRLRERGGSRGRDGGIEEVLGGRALRHARRSCVSRSCASSLPPFSRSCGAVSDAVLDHLRVVEECTTFPVHTVVHRTGPRVLLGGPGRPPLRVMRESCYNTKKATPRKETRNTRNTRDIETVAPAPRPSASGRVTPRLCVTVCHPTLSVHLRLYSTILSILLSLGSLEGLFHHILLANPA